MAVFGNPRKPKNVSEGLGLETAGGVRPSVAPPMANQVAGGMMGSLTDMAMERKKEVGGMQSDQSALFTDEKKKRMKNGFTNAPSGFGPA